jgi:hypothetical protein
MTQIVNYPITGGSMARRTGWIFLVVGAAALAALFAAFRPGPEPAASPQTAAPVAAGVAADAPASEPRVFELQVKEGRLAVGPTVISVVQGQDLVLRVTSDTADELHLHGYELALRLQAGVPGELRFVAHRGGRFEYELHHAHAEIGVLEVQPR